MCLAVIGLDAHPLYPLVVAANRDEWHARAATPAAWGTQPPYRGILAGRDLVAGGTWLGIRRDGRWALLTNVREGLARDTTARSRGELVLQLLSTDEAPVQSLRKLIPSAHDYNGFNVIVGEPGHAAWTSNRAPSVDSVPPGIHGLSNAFLDTPWPKVVGITALLGEWSARGEADTSVVFDWLADRRQAPDEELPATGVTRERERLLSAPFIVSDTYGTRCSTVITIDRDGRVRFRERSFDATGSPVGEVDYAFELG